MSVKKKVAAPKTTAVAAPAKKVVKKAAGPKPEINHGVGRKVLFDQIQTMEFSLKHVNGPMTSERMKTILGWTEVPDDDPNPLDYDVLDNERKKIRLKNNVANRPFRTALGRTWESEVLYDRWNGGLGNGPNGETIIVGRTGLVLDGQHRGVGFVLAVQEWHADQAKDPAERRWTNWDKEPVVECLVVFGISEESKVVDTINTGEPRSLADVLFRDDQYFGELTGKERVTIAKIAEHAIRMLAHRTAAFADAFAPNRTHSEQIEFLHRHPKLLQCVKRIFESDTNGSITEHVSLGSAAALMFLMGCAGDTGEKYRNAERPTDSMLKWGHWELADQFWTGIGDKLDRFFEPLSAARAVIAQDAQSVSKPERIALVVKAWDLFSRGKPITHEAIALSYRGEGEERHLAETPLVCPIDVGSPKELEEAEEAANAGDPDDYEPEKPTEEQKELRKRTRGKLTKPLKIGMKVWVVGDPVETSWSGELVELAGKNARVKVDKKFAGAGKTVAVKVIDLLDRQP